PSPLVGEGQGGGWRQARSLRPPPSPTLPHKGEGEDAASEQRLRQQHHFAEKAAYPWASRRWPPTRTGGALTSTKAITQSSGPWLTQLWIVPRCTSTSPALRLALTPSSSSISIAPDITTA